MPTFRHGHQPTLELNERRVFSSYVDSESLVWLCRNFSHLQQLALKAPDLPEGIEDKRTDGVSHLLQYLVRYL